MPGIVFVNPDSGPDPMDLSDLAGHFPGHEVVECDPADLPARVNAAMDEEVEFVAVAGGDGTIRCAAQALAESDIPLLPIPAGTRNHFARELGIEDLETAGRAAAAGTVRRIDLGEVNGHRFINNSSIGVYPRIVVTRETHERRWPKGLATVSAAWQQLRHGRRFIVSVDGRRYRAWMVFVGNGPYGRGLLRLNARESLDDNTLDFRLARADSPFSRARVVLALVSGALERSPLLVQRQTRHVELALDRPVVEVALDGEVQRMEGPLRYRSLPGALSVLAPPEETGRKTADR
ncbi:MAG: diacylglycerol kinase family protein [Acidimicrobiales bacterium]